MPRIPVMADDLPPSMVEMLRDEIDVFNWDAALGSASLERAEALVTYGHPRVDVPLLDRAPRLKVVSNHGVGVDHIDVAACEARGIPVGNTPGVLDQSTADMTFALLLAAARNVVCGDAYARGPEFTHYDPSFMIGKEVSGSTIGIIGFGRIGQQVAQRARGFDMRILYHSRSRKPDAEAALGAEYRSLDDLLRESDFITLNCPLTPETQNLIGASQLQRMKPNAVLVNLARGGVVDHPALWEALTAGTIAGAAVDVTEPEPLPRDHPLLNVPNLIITPHLGSASDRTRRKMQEMTVENLWAGLRGEPLPYRVRPAH